MPGEPAKTSELASEPAAGPFSDRWQSCWSVLAGALCLCWPGLYNGFPLIYPDSMTYLDDGRIVARALFLHQLSGYYGMRSFFYSLAILPLHWNVNPWPVVVVQSLLVAWVLWLVVRAVLTRHRCVGYLLLVAALSGLTSISWYVSLILPDILGPMLYLSLFLLVFAEDSLARWERWGLYFVAWLGITSHSTHLLMAAGLLLLLIALRLGLSHRRQSRMRPSGRSLARVAGILALAAGAQLALHGYLYGHPSLSGERPPFLTARIIADGPGKWYLQAHCGQLDWVICRSVDRLPTDPDVFLWGADGVWQNLQEDDAKRMLREEVPFVLATLRTYPQAQLSRSAVSFLRQLTIFGLNDLDPSGWVLEEFPSVLPRAQAAYLAGRQGRGALPLDDFTDLQHSVVEAAVVLIAVLLGFMRRGLGARLVGLGMMVIWVTLTNALITGTLSMVEDRLQARVVWMVPMYAGLLVLAWRERSKLGRRELGWRGLARDPATE